MKVKKGIAVVISVCLCVAIMSGCTGLQNKITDETKGDSKDSQNIAPGDSETNDKLGNVEIGYAYIVDEFGEGNYIANDEVGKKYLRINWNMKNTSNEDVSVEKFADIKVRYDENKQYDDTSFHLPDTTDLRLFGSPDLTPLVDTKVVTLTSIPDEVAGNVDKIQLTVRVFNEWYSYNEKIEQASDFEKTFKEQADVFYDALSDFTSKLRYEFPFIYDEQGLRNKIAEEVPPALEKMKSVESATDITAPAVYKSGADEFRRGVAIYREYLEKLSQCTTASEVGALTFDEEGFNNAHENAVSYLTFLSDTVYGRSVR